MKRGVTDDNNTDRTRPLMMPSVIISPTKLIHSTDRISSSVKLFNSTVIVVIVAMDDPNSLSSIELNLNHMCNIFI